ncbi:MAG: HAD-IB family phosphatase [Candidatus Zixiibacteriota bacterium]
MDNSVEPSDSFEGDIAPNNLDDINMITVIIPVLNEEKTISKVVRFVKMSPSVDEIIVVDDKSIDNTVQEAIKTGARVVTSTKIGKGASMRDGLLLAKNDIIVYLDGDIDEYPPDTIEKLTTPIIRDEADFVKATFQRKAGRVTELVAKPLLHILFPELSVLTQPLSGIIAAKRKLLENMTFEDDYGVDIGIFIDMYLQKARIVEINIGKIEHKMKQWQQLSGMSREVSRAILKRALKYSKTNLDELGTINIIRDQMEFAIKETSIGLRKIVIFDLDNTIFEGRFIEKAAGALGFQKEFYDILKKNNDPFLITKLIARLFSGVNIAKIIEIADSVPIVSDTPEVITELKRRGYISGIISDSYDCVANHIKNKLGLDFSLANELEFSLSVATGEVKIPSFFIRSDKSACTHNYCKTNAVSHIAERYSIELSNIVAIGDSENDICMIENVGIGVSFCSNNRVLNYTADKVIGERSFKPLLEFT